MYVSEVRITVLDQEDKVSCQDLPIVVDGHKIIKKVSRVVINRLYKQDGEQANIPIQTFLPLKTYEPNKY